MQEIIFPVTRLITGSHSLQRLPDELRRYEARRVFLVMDKALGKLEPGQNIRKVLDEHGFTYQVYNGVEGDPDTEVVERGLEHFKRFGADFLVAFGGGSSIDTAKAIAILAKNGGKLRSYEGIDKFSEQPIPIIAVPTTAGTGSEVSPAAVITDPQEHFKFTVRSWRIAPKTAILDPVLLRTLPASVAAATGMDALCHNVEYFLAKSASPLSEGINLQAIRMIGEHFRAFVQDRTNEHAASQMLMASMMGEISFALLRLSVNHAIAAALGGRYRIHHGLACGILLPYSLRFNLDVCLNKLPLVAEALQVNTYGMNKYEASEAAINAIERLKEDIGIPKGLKGFNIPESDIDHLVKDTMKSAQIKVNPKPVTQEDVRQILLQALEN